MTISYLNRKTCPKWQASMLNQSSSLPKLYNAILLHYITPYSIYILANSE